MSRDKDQKRHDRNDDLDKGRHSRMFSGIVTGAQDHFQRQQQTKPDKQSDDKD